MSAESPAVSFVIPAWRDAENLSTLLPRLSTLSGRVEIIVVDVPVEGRPPCRPNDFINGPASTKVRIVCVPRPNRGEQMNLGASLAAGDVLIFQHADTEFSELHLQAIETALSDTAVVGGAFHRKFDDRHPRLRWLERVARWRGHHGGTLFGDQTIFVRREVFMQLRGFAPIPLMEDVEFSKRLRRAGKIALLDPPVRSSARHHQRKGAWRTSIQNGLFLLFFKAGVSPITLHRWYYGANEPA
ncbi:MAG TPA: TIGR04283 family arsenosugar biosynthesis glycosyltransferase [Chthoniobacterales bacterium]|nr:TIGR04283 family arsenosugar biosynthesis glycosyltransferase [Chthoniobacterales bacterium]